MLNITKSTTPLGLAMHRRTKGARYANLPSEAQSELKSALLEEQGYLCCYCMQRVHFDDMRVEHWQCQSFFPEQELDYSNLLAACHGNEAKRKHGNAHCDVAKANKILKYNPAKPEHDVEAHIKYRSDGSICSTDDEFNDQLEKILNLNCPDMKLDRKKTRDGVKQSIQKWTAQKRTAGKLKRAIQDWRSPDPNDGMMRPYAGIVIYYLEKRLKQL